LVTLHVWGVSWLGAASAAARLARDRVAVPHYPGVTFAKLLGTGSGRTFAPQDADLRHWALLTCWDSPHAAATFQNSKTLRRWDAAATERFVLHLQPIASRGTWSGREPFGRYPAAHDADTADANDESADKPVAAITRARLRLGTARQFWQSIPRVAEAQHNSPGLVWSLAVGEAPIGYQGTVSVWRDAEALQAFAYGDRSHRDVIEKTRTTGWYAEDLFARFSVLSSEGTFDGSPVQGRGR
jgi:heme-degrading monooxygenase HmoA